jgi:hypothetical protein
LEAKEFGQKEGIEFDLTYFPTINQDCIKLILFIEVKFKLKVQQLYIKAANLDVDLDKNINVSIPPEDINYNKGFSY